MLNVHLQLGARVFTSTHWADHALTPCNSSCSFGSVNSYGDRTASTPASYGVGHQTLSSLIQPHSFCLPGQGNTACLYWHRCGCVWNFKVWVGMCVPSSITYSLSVPWGSQVHKRLQEAKRKRCEHKPASTNQKGKDGAKSCSRISLCCLFQNLALCLSKAWPGDTAFLFSLRLNYNFA